jgi:hypothetical protein
VRLPISAGGFSLSIGMGALNIIGGARGAGTFAELDSAAGEIFPLVEFNLPSAKCAGPSSL